MIETVATKTVKDRRSETLSRLSRCREEDGRMLIDLPIMHPSGAMVVVEVECNRDKFMVSDMGYGLVEAEFMAAQDFYGSAAKKMADEFSVEFRESSIFSRWVSGAQLESAIICVSNASSKAASEAISRASEAQKQQQNVRVFDRIAEVFGRAG